MGGAMVLPDNARLKKTMKTFALSRGEMAKLWSSFNRLDKQKIGKIRAFSIFDGEDIKKSVLCGALFQLLDIELENEEETLIGFPEFVHCVVQLCCFEQNEMLRFCLHACDPERNGYIATEDFKALMNSLHGIIPPEKATGNIRHSWGTLLFPASDKIEIDDIQQFNSQAPLILSPAFRFQYLVAEKYGGVEYWDRKKRRLNKAKERAAVALAKKRAKRDRKRMKHKEAAIKKSMGVLRYYMCPCIRFMWDADDERYLTEQQRLERAAVKRADELKMKNPETTAWKILEKKIDPTQGGNEKFVEEKLVKTDRPREGRALTRAERRSERKMDDSLAHKFRLLGDDVDVMQ